MNTENQVETKKKPATSARHSSASVEHFTPGLIIEAARATMGAIDLDPASCAIANTVVRADRFFDASMNGLNWPWVGRVWLNPPGGVAKGKSQPKVWWTKLVDEYNCGRVEQAFFLAFNMEFLQTSQTGTRTMLPLEFPFCVPSRRIGFLNETDGKLAAGGSPTHANAIFYLPPERRRELAIDKFESLFSGVGHVVVPRGGE